jgi:hypothetical protein
MASKNSGKRAKLVRDSFTIPKAEFAAIDSLKLRAITQGIAVKKSELLRAGLMVLVGLNDAAFKAALTAVPTLKTGRPSAEEPVTVTVAPKAASKAPAAPKAVKPAAKAATPKPATKPVAKAAPVRSAQKAAAPAASRTRAAIAKPVKPVVAKTAPRLRQRQHRDR